MLDVETYRQRYLDAMGERALAARIRALHALVDEMGRDMQAEPVSAAVPMPEQFWPLLTSARNALFDTCERAQYALDAGAGDPGLSQDEVAAAMHTGGRINAMIQARARHCE